MPFQITRTNANRRVSLTGSKQFNSREEAFRAAARQELNYRTAKRDSLSDDGDEDTPPIARAYKTYTRPNEGEIELRFDYKVGAEHFTNSIYWRVIEV